MSLGNHLFEARKNPPPPPSDTAQESGTSYSTPLSSQSYSSHPHWSCQWPNKKDNVQTGKCLIGGGISGKPFLLIQALHMANRRSNPSIRLFRGDNITAVSFFSKPLPEYPSAPEMNSIHHRISHIHPTHRKGRKPMLKNGTSRIISIYRTKKTMFKLENALSFVILNKQKSCGLQYGKPQEQSKHKVISRG